MTERWREIAHNELGAYVIQTWTSDDQLVVDAEPACKRIAELEKSDRTNSLKVVMLCTALSAYKPREAIDDAMREIDAICNRMDDGGYSDD